MMKRVFVSAIAVLSIALAGGAAAAPAASAQTGGGCQLSGSANISPGLTSTAQNFSYNFTGNLSNCQSNPSGPASGTVFAGTNGLPAPTGNGSCVNSTTSGIAVIQWADGTATVVQYSTNGALAALSLQGTVIASVTSSTGTTYTTTRYASDSALGQLAFQPPDPTACASTGVTTAGISGTVEVGTA
jgi:hypothetical protein